MPKLQREEKPSGDLETLELFFQQLPEEIKMLRIELDTIASDIEQIDRNILKADAEAENLLAEYRGCLHDGKKDEADSKLDLVSEKRSEIEDLEAQRIALVKKITAISDTKDKIYARICAQSSSEVFKSLLDRTNKLLLRPSQCFGALQSVGNKILKVTS